MNVKIKYYLAIIALLIVQIASMLVTSTYIDDFLKGCLFFGCVLLLCLYVEVCIIIELNNLPKD